MKKLIKQFEHKDERGSFNELYRGGNWKEFNFSTINTGFTRGGHYHKETEELIFVAKGRCEFKAIDLKNNKNVTTVFCDENEGVIIYPYEVHYVNAIEDSKLMSLLSMPYDKENPDNFTAEL